MTAGDEGSPAEPEGKTLSSSRPAQSPTTSVVIPVKDDAAMLARCLRALHAQNRPADEIIVVDNDSSDTTASVARAWGARVLTCLEPGIAAAASTGYDAARGDLILRLDADCEPDAEWITAIVAGFDDDEHLGAITGPARFTDGPVALRTPLARLYLGAYTSLLTVTLGHLPLFGSNLAFRREAWHAVRSDVHRSDPEIHDDLDLAFHLGEKHRIARLPDASMGMSMRPLVAGQFGRRVHRGVRSVVVHWPRDFPPVRWARLLLRRRLHGPARRRTR